MAFSSNGHQPGYQLGSLQLFDGQEHQPFLWPGARPAALLLHGLMGTPAELRPLAAELHAAGWTVQGLLLPGFGPQLGTLFSRRWSDWAEATREALQALRAQHRPLLLIGYSMGASVALNVAAQTPVDGLVLLAPFWKVGTTSQQLIWQGMKRLFPHIQPFKKADFADPRLRELFDNLLPGLDIMDPPVQSALRELRIPSRFIDQVFDLGRAAARAAETLHVPTHIIQGLDDETVTPQRTRQLLQRLAATVSYEEVATGHELVAAEDPGFQQTARSVLHYARRLLAPQAQSVAPV